MASLKGSETHCGQKIFTVGNGRDARDEIKDVEGGYGIRFGMGCRYCVRTNKPAVHVDNGSKELVCKMCASICLLKIDSVR